jgi:hypothetical protein
VVIPDIKAVSSRYALKIRKGRLLIGIHSKVIISTIKQVKKPINPAKQKGLPAGSPFLTRIKLLLA